MKTFPDFLKTGWLYLVLLMLMQLPLSALPADSLSGALQHYFDSIVPQQLKATHLPCLVVSVVSNDTILFEKGYGDVNLAKKIPADPKKTVWRLASISKVITATAVMQLVEQGKLDLDRNVNDYLKVVKVPEKFGKPVTLRNLLTHTAGFDDNTMGKSFRKKTDLPSLQQFLKNLPERIYPPGAVFLYSNIGNALAALVVQDVSGQDFNDYCRQHIFLPLGMQHTSYRLNDTLLSHLYQAYARVGGQLTPVPFDYLGDYPAGQLLSTADEFSRFMMCQLNLGTLDGVQILKPETAKAMESTQFTENPKLNNSIGFVYNLFDVAGNKVASHDGGYVGVATRMWLLPGRKVGLLMATNVMDIRAIQTISYDFVRKFFDRQQPAAAHYPLDSLPAYDKHVERFTGYYRFNRYSHNAMLNVGFLFGYGAEIHIWKNDKGMLMMNDYFGHPRRLIQVEPGLFRSIDDDYYMAFQTVGKYNFLYVNGTAAFEKVSVFYSKQVQTILLGSLITFFLLILLVRLIHRLLSGKNRKKHIVAHQKLISNSSWTSGLFLLHLLGLGLVFFILHPSWELFDTGFAYGAGTDLYVVQSVLLVAVITLLLTIVRYLQVLGSRKVAFLTQLFYTLFILSSVLYLWLMHYWNVLGFRF